MRSLLLLNDVNVRADTLKHREAPKKQSHSKSSPKMTPTVTPAWKWLHVGSVTFELLSDGGEKSLLTSNDQRWDREPRNISSTKGKIHWFHTRQVVRSLGITSISGERSSWSDKAILGTTRKVSGYSRSSCFYPESDSRYAKTNPFLNWPLMTSEIPKRGRFTRSRMQKGAQERKKAKISANRSYPQHGSEFPKEIPENFPETLSELFLEFLSRVRLGSPKRYNSRHLKAPEHVQNSLPPSTAGDASFSEVVLESAS